MATQASLAGHLHETDLELYVRGGLLSERVDLFDRHLSSCFTCMSRLRDAIGVQLPVTSLSCSPLYDQLGRRAETRFGVDDVAKLQEISPLSVDRLVVSIIDVSKSGLGLLVPKNLWPGTLVQIRMGTITALGEVRHCVMVNGAYRAGVLLRQVWIGPTNGE